MCFGPPGKWRESLVGGLGIAALGGTVDWERLAVLWEDRNVIIHPGSVSDSRHSDRTGSPASTPDQPALSRRSGHARSAPLPQGQAGSSCLTPRRPGAFAVTPEVV